MKAKPHVVLITEKAQAFLFFGVELHAREFVEMLPRYDRYRPSFIIYQETLYTHPRVRFGTGDAGVIYFRSSFPMSIEEYDALYRHIVQEHLRLHTPTKPTSDHAADALAYAIRAETPRLVSLSEERKRQIEKQLIDQMDIPALEKSLREAVRVENYEAAAHIRDRARLLDHVIVEREGKLRLRHFKVDLAEFINDLPLPD